ncbi:MAG TPA: hypothetical protein VIT93_06795, partial [Dehalococcoidia bacterium]
MTELRRRLVEAPDPDAPRECRMTPDEGRRRGPSMSRLFANLAAEQNLDDGIEYVFAGDSPKLWDDIAAYVDEESVCCPFFTFDQ